MRVAFYSTSAENLFRFRLPVARRLAEVGYEVLFIGPEGPFGDDVEKAGFTYLPFRSPRRPLTPFSELAAGIRLGRIYRRENPDIVHHFGLSAIVQGGTAARSAGLPWIVHSVPSLDRGTLETKWLRPGPRLALRWSMRDAEVTVQTPEDRHLLLFRGILRSEQTHLIGGDVIDPELISFVEEPAYPPVAAWVGDPQSTTDLETFVDSARHVRGGGASTSRFVFVASEKEVSDEVRSQLEAWQEAGEVDWWPRRDLEAAIARVHVVCTPACKPYRLRSILLTAAAIGRPIVAADLPACRDIVRPGVTGMLVPPRDVNAWSSALEGLLANAERRREIGRNARAFIEKEYAAKRVASHMMTVYQRLYERGREI